MARYLPTIRTNDPDTLDGLHPGQWIDYQGARGRYMGRKNGSVWIAWGGTARKRFDRFALAFHVTPEREEPANDNSEKLFGIACYLIFAFAAFVILYGSGVSFTKSIWLVDLWHAIQPHYENFS